MKLHTSLSEQFSEHVEIIREGADVKIDQTLTGLSLCESPLEQKFLLEYLGFHTLTYEPVFVSGFSHFIVVDDDYCGFTLLKPQAPVTIEGRQYRADFLFTYRTYRPMLEHFRFIVEIDGHAFHERTKEQAKRDRQRDRLMTMEGYTVFRYTGSEIYHNAGAAVVEFNSYFRRLKQAALSEIRLD